MTRDQLSKLRQPLTVLVVVIALVAAAVYYTDLMVQRSALDLTRKKGEFQTAQTRMRQSGDEKNTIVQYADKYRELEKGGFAGEEQRINWLDALRNANTRAQLFGVSYQIGVQHPYPHTNELSPGGVKLLETTMELDMRLMHEGDLLLFLDELRAQNVGLFHVNECSLTRTERAETLRNQPYLSAQCNLAWITARSPPRTTGAKP